MKKTKVFYVICIIGIFSVTFYLSLEEVFSSQDEKPSQRGKDICNTINDDFSKNICVNLVKSCRKAPKSQRILCVAGGLGNSGNVNASYTVCLNEKTENQKIFCFAHAITRINPGGALNMCNRIEDDASRINCRANVLKFYNKTEALVECEKNNELNEKYLCVALIKAFDICGSNSYVLEGKKYCELINSSSLKESCFRKVPLQPESHPPDWCY